MGKPAGSLPPCFQRSLLPGIARAADADNDGVDDLLDAFPDNAMASADANGNGVGDNEENAGANRALLRDRSAYFGVGHAPLDVADRGMYGRDGMLPHFAERDSNAMEFRRGPDSEVSSIDTALLLYGLMVNAQYFGGDVATDYLAARDGVDWSAWIDVATVGHIDQFRQSYDAGSDSLPNFWYDTYTHEVMLLVIMAAMSDPTLNVLDLWRAWNRQTVSYGGRSTYATWNGDPFTVFYGLVWLDLQGMGADVDGVNWYDEAALAYDMHLEFFASERSFLSSTSAAFHAGATNPIAEPKLNPASVSNATQATIYSIAGGLLFYRSFEPSA